MRGGHDQEEGSDVRPAIQAADSLAVVSGVHEVVSDRDGETARMTKAMTIEDATKALDDAIARHKAAQKAAADLYSDVIAAREALNSAFADEDETLPQCVVAVGGIRSYTMVVVERNKDRIKCRYFGDRGGHLTFKWDEKECAYMYTRGGVLDRSRRIVALCCKPLSGSDDRGRAVTP